MKDPNDFPRSLRSVFANSEFELFRTIELLLAFPEYETPLPGGRRPSQSDVFVLATSVAGLVSITVEGKVSEPFGQVVSEWKDPPTSGKHKRLEFLCENLGLGLADVDSIRYQLLHRTVSALIEADTFGASHALMLIHSFSQANEWFEDFGRFLALFGAKAAVDSIVHAPRRHSDQTRFREIDLYLGWVKD